LECAPCVTCYASAPSRGRSRAEPGPQAPSPGARASRPAIDASKGQQGRACPRPTYAHASCPNALPAAPRAPGGPRTDSPKPIGPVGGGKEQPLHLAAGAVHEARPGRYECVFQHLGQPLQLFRAADGRLVESNAAAQALLLAVSISSRLFRAAPTMLCVSPGL
jgi:hypothetical protein